MANDGTVEIKITGSVDGSVAASTDEVKSRLDGVANSATVSAAAMSKALQQAGGDVTKITPAMLGLAAATQGTAAAAAENAAATIGSAAATDVDTVATTTNAAAHISSRVATESLVLVHEALSGRYTKMTGSAMILTQALVGQEAVSGFLAAALSPLGLAIGAVTIATGVAIFSARSYAAEQKQLTATTIGLGAASGLSAAALTEAAGAAATYAGESTHAALGSAEAFASAGVQSRETIQALSGDVQTYAELTGIKFADSQKELATAMQDPIKGAQDLNEKLGILDSTQMEQIRTMTEAGDKTGAVTVLTQALQARMDEARAAGVGLSGTFETMGADLRDLWGWLGKVNTQLELFTSFGPMAGSVEQQINAQKDAAARQAQNDSFLSAASTGGMAAYGATPEGRDKAQQDSLIAGLTRSRNALIADTAVRGEHSEAAKRDLETMAEYTRAIQTYVPAAEKAHRISELDAKIAEARHGHDKQKIKDLTEQKSLLSTAGEIMSGGDAQQKAQDAGALAADRSDGGHAKHGPSVASEWAEQLHAQEIASGEFFKDQTEKELAFWQGKVGLVKTGSKEWLEVQSHIYEAQKKLAHDSYNDQIATMDEQLQADRDNWAKEKGDWDQKLAFIASKYGEEGKEYKDAHRQFEAAEHQHNEEMLAAQRDGERQQIASLKSHMQAMRQVREEDARASEAVIRADSGSSPLGDIKAEVAIAASRQQLNEQELADLASTYAAEDAIRVNDAQRAKATYTEDSKQYQTAANAKKAADQQYADQRLIMEARIRQQSIQSILSIQQAYHGYIDGVVSSTTSGMVGLIGRTQTWAQAVRGVYTSLLSAIDNVLTKMVTNWVVKHVFMSAAQKAELAIQTAAHSASEVAKSAATASGAATRTGAEIGANVAALVSQKAMALSQVATFVALAGAGGTASMAAAPFPIDLGAPAFGAQMAAAAASFGVGASLAQGTNSLPRDMIIQAHEGERIMPKGDNQAIMSAINGGGKGRGDTNLTYAPQLSGDTKPFRQQLLDHSSDLMAMISRAMRDGELRAA